MADINHLMFNMFALFFFGSFLESIIGEKRFLILFLTTGILVNILTIPFYQASLGASGAIFGLLGTLTVLRPKATVFFGFFMPMPLILAAGIYLLLDLVGVFFSSGTANLAHIAGLGLGALFGFYWRRILAKMTRPEYFEEIVFKQ